MTDTRHCDMTTAMSFPGDLITSVEAGNILGKSSRTVIRAAENGKLRVAQKLPGPNGAYLFSRDDVEAWALELAS